MKQPHLIYFADPMCSWCWGFSPVIEAIRARFGADLPIRLILGGLRPGTHKPMDAAAKLEVRAHWEHVHEASGQPFDFGFFAREGFVYDTEPAARAVVVVRRQGMDRALDALKRLHAAFYAENRDVTDARVLADVVSECGLDRDAFLQALQSEAARDETWRDFVLTQKTGIGGFPALIAGAGEENAYSVVTLGFQPAERILPALERWREGIPT